jgi:UDPglucose 6-dehydrogenase
VELAETTHRRNRALPEKIVKKLKKLVPPGATVAILGLSYKPASDCIEESQGVLIAEILVKQGYRVKAYDPLANESAARHFQGTVEIAASIPACLEKADAVLLTTPDPAFKSLSPDHFPQEKRVVVIDFWRLLRERLQNSSHVSYLASGLSGQEKAQAKKLNAIWRSAGETGT